MSARNQNGNYQIVLSTKLNLDTLNNQIKEINKNPPEIKIKVSIDNKSLERIKELNELLSKTEALNNYTNGLKNIQTTMKSYEQVASKVVKATNNLANSVQGAGNASKTAGEHVKSFGEKAMDAFQKFSLWSVVSGMFYKIVRAAEELIDTAIELDTAFTELSKVTDLTRDDFDQLTQQAYELGSEVAKTTTEVINAMTEFARAGYNVNESTDILAKNALMWTNIADGTVNASESANMMISVMKAFNVQAKDSTHIIDALNEVSNNYAISSGQLSNSLTKSSAVLANANVTFEEQLGLITAGTEILRNANTVSNGLRTISLRLQGMEEDGEKVDGLTAKLEGDFNKLGLTLYETNGDLKDTYQILYELAPVYQTMSAAQKAYYTELIAGKTRAQIAAAILNNFSTAINATETAYNSAGSAAKENEKVLESLNGHIQAFRAEWESLINSKATQDTLKFLIDIGTNIIKLIKDLGGLKTILISIGVVIAAMKWKLLITAITTTISGLKLYIATLGKTSTALITESQAASLAAARTLLFNAAIAASVIAIVALVEWVNYLSEAHERNAQSVKDAVSEYEGLVNEEKEIKSKIQEIDKEIDELNKNKIDIIDDDTITKLEAERKELELQLAIKEKLVAIAKKEASDKAKGAILGSGSLTRSELENAGVDTTDVGRDSLKYGLTLNPITSLVGVGYQIGEATQNWTSFIGETISLIDASENLNKVLNEEKKELIEVQKAYTNGDITKKEYENKTKKLQEAIKEHNNQLDNNSSALSKNVSELLEYRSALDVTDPEAEKMIKVIDHLNGEYLTLGETLNTFNDVWNKATDDEKKKLKELSDSGELTIATFTENFPRLSAYFSKFSQESGISFSEIIDKIAELINKEDELSVTTQDNFESALKTLTTALGENKTAYDTLSSAVKEYQENGELSTQTLVTLIEKYPQYLDALNQQGYSLDVVNSLLKGNTEELFKNAEAENQMALEAQFGNGATIDLAKAENELFYQNKLLGVSFQDLKYDIAGYQQALQDMATYEANNKVIEQYEKRKKILDDLRNSSYSSGKSGSSSSSKDTWKDAFTKAYNDLKNRRDRDLIDTETYYKELNELNKKYFEGRKEYAEEYAKYELELYKGLQEAFKENIENMEHDYTMLENQGVGKDVLINKYKEIQDELHRQAEYYRSLNLDGNKDLIDKLSEDWWKYQKNIEKLQKEITDELKKNLDEQIDELKKRFEALRDVALDTIEKQIDEKQNWLEEQNDLLDEQIDKYKDQKDTMEDEKEIQEKLLKIEEARKKLAEAKNKRVRVYREGKGFVYETDFDAVNEAQEQLNDLLEDWQLFQEKARIQDIVEQLEAEKQANKDRVNKEIEDLNRLKDAWDKSLDLAQDVENYKGWLTKIENSESSSFDSRLNLVKEFVKSYNAEMAQLKTQYPEESKSATSISGSGGSGGVTVKKYNGVSYNPNVDYQQMINDAKAAGAPEDHLVSLEKKRNAKIAGEGIIDYSPTYNYTSPSGYASGTERADGLLHVVGENGPELYVPPEGSGILPNNITSNLMNWGAINPMQLVKNLASNSGTVINVDNISLPNVKDGDSFVNELKNFKSFAIQRESNRK